MPFGPGYPYRRKLRKHEQKFLRQMRREEFKRQHPFLFDNHGKRKARP